jgi:hypothetical protein
MNRSSKIRETDIIKYPDISYDRMLINQVVLSLLCNQGEKPGLVLYDRRKFDVFAAAAMSPRHPDSSLPAKPSHFLELIERPTFIQRRLTEIRKDIL